MLHNETFCYKLLIGYIQKGGMHPSSGSGTSGTTIARCLGGHYALSVDLLYEVCMHIERLTYELTLILHLRSTIVDLDVTV